MWLEWLVNHLLRTEESDVRLEWTFASHYHSPPLSQICLSVCLQWFAPVLVVINRHLMEEHSPEPFAVHSECPCQRLHSPVNFVNSESEHKSDYVNLAFSLQNPWINTQMTCKKSVWTEKSEWWPLRLGVVLPTFRRSRHSCVSVLHDLLKID